MPLDSGTGKPFEYRVLRRRKRPSGACFHPADSTSLSTGSTTNSVDSLTRHGLAGRSGHETDIHQPAKGGTSCRQRICRIAVCRPWDRPGSTANRRSTGQSDRAFRDSDVFAVIQVDVARLNVAAVVSRDTSAMRRTGFVADGMKTGDSLVRRPESGGGEGAVRRFQHHRYAGPAVCGRAAGRGVRRLTGSHGRFMPSRCRSIDAIVAGLAGSARREFAVSRPPPGRSFRPRSRPWGRMLSPLRLFDTSRRPTAAACSKSWCRTSPPSSEAARSPTLTHGLIWAAAGIENAEKPAPQAGRRQPRCRSRQVTCQAYQKTSLPS